MSALMWITKKELERVIKNKADDFKTWKFHSSVEKMRNASGQQGELSGSEKNKSEQEHKKQNFWWTHTRIPP